MAVAFTPITLTTFTNDTTAVTQTNTNNTAIQTAMQDSLSRSGNTPNQMNSTLDMNSSQIINLPAPATLNSPLRVVDVSSQPITVNVPPTGTSGGTVPFLNGNNTWSGVQNFNSGDVVLKGATSGTVTLVPVAVAGSNTITFPAATDTTALLAATQTLTNKTISGASNTISNVSLATGVTGNLPVTNLNSGTGASSSTFWRGDGVWGSATGATGSANQVAIFTGTNVFSGSSNIVTNSNNDLLVSGFLKGTAGSARLTSNFNATSSTTLTAVSGLSISLEAALIYMFEYNILANIQSAGAGLKIDLNGGTISPTNFRWRAEAYEEAASVGNLVGITNSGSSITNVMINDPFAAYASFVHIRISGIVDNTSGSAGTIIPRFAQNVSNASASQVLANSYTYFQLIS